MLAGLSQWYFSPYSEIPSLGASGAIAGVMGAYIFRYPKVRILTFVPLGFLMPTSSEDPFVALSFMPVVMLLQYAIPAVYDTWFVGKYGATPGKMACKIKIVLADGTPVTYSRALGRHFAKWVSSLILMIGFLMAAFDDERRTLHDRICETRVVRK